MNDDVREGGSELNRIGELADERQIRVAGNDRKMSNVSFELHDRSRPMTGAIFDTVVELYHQALVERDLADERLLQTNIRNFDDVFLGKLSELTARSYSESAFLFKSALTEARDVVGLTLASCWNRLDPMNISFESAAEILVDEAALINSTAGRVFERNFEWRQIL